MISLLIESVANFLWGWATIDIIVGGAAVAIAVLEPAFVTVLIPDLRKWAIGTAVVAFTCMGILAHGYSNGLSEKQRQWDSAVAQETKNGELARADAVRAIGPDTADRRVFAHDTRNRDSGKHATRTSGALRWVESHNVLRR